MLCDWVSQMVCDWILTLFLAGERPETLSPVLTSSYDRPVVYRSVARSKNLAHAQDDSRRQGRERCLKVNINLYPCPGYSVSVLTWMGSSSRSAHKRATRTVVHQSTYMQQFTPGKQKLWMTNVMVAVDTERGRYLWHSLSANRYVCTSIIFFLYINGLLF